jgi:hypothetical protein
MVINCERVWIEVSSYLDGDVDAELRAAIEEHLRGCERCAAVVHGTRNVVQLYGDERLLEVPSGFSERMQQRINNSLPAWQSPPSARPAMNVAWTRRGFLGWAGAAAAAALLAGIFEMNKPSLRNSSQAALRSQLAQPAAGVPPDMTVVVTIAGKIFHRAGCTFILNQDKTRTLTAGEAMREGFSPCVRCMKQYLIRGVASPSV